MADILGPKVANSLRNKHNDIHVGLIFKFFMIRLKNRVVNKAKGKLFAMSTSRVIFNIGCVKG